MEVINTTHRYDTSIAPNNHPTRTLNTIEKCATAKKDSNFGVVHKPLFNIETDYGNVTKRNDMINNF